MFQPLSLLLLAAPLGACASSGALTPPADAQQPVQIQANEDSMPRHLVPRRPALSPDGTRVAYSHSGDIWVANLANGLATRLTAHPGYDTSPVWSPSGNQIAFGANRHGNFDVFVVPATGGTPERLTWLSESESIHGWVNEDEVLIGITRDRWYNQYGRGKGLWTVNTAAETPMLLGDFPAGRSTVSPDGRYVCYEKGSGDQRRRAYRGPAANDLWLFDMQTGEHRELTQSDGSEFCPQFSKDGKTVFFLSDKECSSNPNARDLGLWKISTKGGKANLVYHPGQGRSLRYCSVSAETGMAVSELDDHFVLIDTANGEATPLDVFGGNDSSIPTHANDTVTSGASDLKLSPDGETIVFVARGDLYAMRKHDKIERAARITQNAALDNNPVWIEDGKALLFVSERDGNDEIYRVRPEEEDTPFYLSRHFKVERVTNTKEDETALALSPDGETLAWVQGNGRFVIGDPETLEVSRVIYQGFEAPDYDWSPDSNWLAFSISDDDFNTEIFLVRNSIEGLEADALGVKPYNLTMHPDDDSGPRWSPDGRKLTFTSRRRMLEETDVWICHLRKEDVEMTERERLEAEEAREEAKKEEKKKKAEEEKKAKEAAKKEKAEKGKAAAESGEKPEAKEGQEPEAKKDDDSKEEDEEKKADVEPITIDFDGLRNRLSRLTRSEGNETALGWHHESEKVYFNASQGTRLVSGSTGTTGFFEVDIYDRKPESLSSSTVSSFARGDKEVLYVRSGKVTARGGKESTFPFSVRIREDRAAIRAAVMEQAWGVLNDWFYDTNFHGADWKATLEKWKPIALAASTPEDFEDLMNWMLGELNASHMGFYGDGNLGAVETDRTVTGELGVLWDYSFDGAGRRILEVLPEMPADRDASRLLAGEVITSVNGISIAEDGNWDRLMAGTSGQEVILEVTSADGESREVLIRPSAINALPSGMYDRRERLLREQVESSSEGKLGYLHIQAMGTPSLLEFERKLYAAGHGRDVLLIDVRDNGGGWTTDMVLSMLMVNDHAFTIPRGGGVGYPQGRRIFGTWKKPVVILCNENSYSNAEIFSWAIKTLKRGPLVGKKTFGAVISTGGQGLLDGSFIRMPFRGWYVNDREGTNMELNGCPPDYEVENLPGDYAQGRDRQLEKAIDVGLSLVK